MKYPLILDGATGTQLQVHGMPNGACTESWVLEHPQVLEEIQRGYVAAGSQVVYAPTFGANGVKLEQHGICGQVADYNRRLVEISRRAVDGGALVAGDLAPTGQFIQPMGELHFEQLYRIYLEQVEALENAGVDLYVIETTMTLPEARAALLAVKAVSTRPVYVTFTVDDSGRTLTGTDAVAALVTMQSMGADGFGLNCSTGPEAMLAQLRRLTPHAQIPLIAKPNAGLPQVEEGKTVYHCPPEEFSALVEELAQAGVRIFGGCCGSTAEHIRALTQAVEQVDFAALEQEAPFELSAATEKRAFFLDSVDEEDCVLLDCTEDLLDDLLDAEEEDEALIQLTISHPDELEYFEESQYAVSKPLVLDIGEEAVLEAALRLYQGVAFYRHRGTVSADVLARLSKTYGLRVI